MESKSNVFINALCHFEGCKETLDHDHTPPQIATRRGGVVEIAKAMEYTEKPDELRTLLADLLVEYRWDGIRKHFDDDKECRQCLEVRITRKGQRSISFVYGMSIYDTQLLEVKLASIVMGDPIRIGLKTYTKTAELRKDREEVKAGLLYDILTCCGSEYYCPKSFDDFCAEYGYDTDSRKAEQMHRACLEQSAKLERIFSDEEAQTLPR